jgi:hypothetical protein
VMWPALMTESVVVAPREVPLGACNPNAIYIIKALRTKLIT